MFYLFYPFMIGLHKKACLFLWYLFEKSIISKYCLLWYIQSVVLSCLYPLLNKNQNISKIKKNHEQNIKTIKQPSHQFLLKYVMFPLKSLWIYTFEKNPETIHWFTKYSSKSCYLNPDKDFHYKYFLWCAF